LPALQVTSSSRLQLHPLGYVESPASKSSSSDSTLTLTTPIAATCKIVHQLPKLETVRIPQDANGLAKMMDV
jgi:hypothetical protein